ncbi:hypothetical protein [Bradyrhizobium macuxiense]|uniref:hypothetical protein n=1 Tax=Bradyrhizobium macuxiense TaxID=1755647 RepID=UPI0011BF8C70|nr:hypothetical protein [Bradyrhizobium macuxiense]
MLSALARFGFEAKGGCRANAATSGNIIRWLDPAAGMQAAAYRAGGSEARRWVNAGGAGGDQEARARQAGSARTAGRRVLFTQGRDDKAGQAAATTPSFGDASGDEFEMGMCCR